MMFRFDNVFFTSTYVGFFYHINSGWKNKALFYYDRFTFASWIKNGFDWHGWVSKFACYVCRAVGTRNWGARGLRFLWINEPYFNHGADYAQYSSVPNRRKECVRNLDLRVQVHPGELWVSKQRVHIVLEASKSVGAKGGVPKICGFVHPLHPC